MGGSQARSVSFQASDPFQNTTTRWVGSTTGRQTPSRAIAVTTAPSGSMRNERATTVAGSASGAGTAPGRAFGAAAVPWAAAGAGVRAGSSEASGDGLTSGVGSIDGDGDGASDAGGTADVPPDASGTAISVTRAVLATIASSTQPEKTEP